MTSRRRPTSRKPMFELAGKVSPSTGQNHQRFQIIPARLSKVASIPPDAKTWTIFTAPPLVTIRLKKMRGAPGIVRVRAIISLNNFNTSDTSESTRAASTARYSTWGPKILSWWRISCRLSSDFEQIRSKIRIQVMLCCRWRKSSASFGPWSNYECVENSHGGSWFNMVNSSQAPL